MPSTSLHPDRCICPECIVATLEGALALIERGLDGVGLAALHRLHADCRADLFGAEVARQPDIERRAHLRKALDDGRVTPAEVAAGFRINEDEVDDLLAGRLRLDPRSWHRAARLLTA